MGEKNCNTEQMEILFKNLSLETQRYLLVLADVAKVAEKSAKSTPPPEKERAG